MTGKLLKASTLGMLLVLMLLGIALLALDYSGSDVAGTILEASISLPGIDPSEVPQAVAVDAARLAHQVSGDYQAKYDDFVTQLLAAYEEVKDKDIVVIFNPGGWGTSTVDDSPGWRTISSGIESELGKQGYSSVVLNYRRTNDSLRATFRAFTETAGAYSSKAQDLARKVDFLTSHVPDLKVIIAGESNGTIISDSAMSLLKDNPRVYSIQTGPPVWHRTAPLDRTLVLDTNGVVPDTFARGDLPGVIYATIRSMLGLAPNDNPGRILKFLRAPGHDYRWQYPYVDSQIAGFLEKNFGSKAGGEDAR